MDSSLGSSRAKVHLVDEEAKHGQKSKLTRSMELLGQRVHRAIPYNSDIMYW